MKSEVVAGITVSLDAALHRPVGTPAPLCLFFTARKNSPGSGRPQQPRQPGGHDHQSRAFLQMGEGTTSINLSCCKALAVHGAGFESRSLNRFWGPSL